MLLQKTLIIFTVLIMFIILTIVICRWYKGSEDSEDSQDSEDSEDSESFKIKEKEYINTKLWEDKLYFIDKILYINLNHRTDRDQQIRNELEDKTLLSKIYRVDAIKDTPGSIGCTKSHIKCLEIAIQNGWKNVLILEDDAMFHKFISGYNTLLRLIEKDPHFDVILLGGTMSKFDKSTGKLYSAQTTASYIVNSHYYNTLLQNFKEGLSKLMLIKDLDKIERQKYERNYCIDQYWKNLMKIHNWYIVNPALMVQRPSDSDIENYFVDYTSMFNI